VHIDTREDYDGIIDTDGCDDSPGDDWDGDGIGDAVEVLVAGTNPMDMDSDDDGLCDGHKPPVCTSEDGNNNGIVDPGETDPTNPDTDGDGLGDALERGLTAPETPDTDISSPNWQPDSDPSTTTDPTKPDSDGDGLADGVEDADHDGQKDPGETEPSSGDTDGDGYGDGTDNCPLLASPDNANTDGHDLGDACDADNDDDGFSDADEAAMGSAPLLSGSTPEVCDGVDNDGNEGVDEGFPDTNSDGEADCHDDDFDADGDGIGNASDDNDDSWYDNGSWHDDIFPDDVENYLGTAKDVACWTEQNPIDADPLDCYRDGEAGLYDSMMYYEAPQAYGTALTNDDEGYKRRLDIFWDYEVGLYDSMMYFQAPQAYGYFCPYEK